MSIRTFNSGCFAAGALSLFALAAAAAGPAPAKKAAPAAARKPEPGGRNLKILRGWSHEKIDEAMGFMSASLGVSCDYCHVRNAERKWDFASDERDEKLAARRMLQMTQSLNAKWFEGTRTITCATCHQGRPEPARVPPVDAVVAGAERARAREAQSAPPPAVADLLGKFLRLSGGEAAWRAATARVERGTVVHTSRRGDESSRQENYRAASGRLDQRFSRDGKPLQRLWTDGTGAWFERDGESEPLETADAFKREAIFALPLALAARTDLKLDGREKYFGAETWVLRGRPDETTKERWFFSDDGLLLGVYRESETASGPMPEMTRFEDYRAVGPLQLPFVIRTVDPWSRAVFTIDEIKLDEPVDPASFAPPVPKPGAH